MVADRSRTFSPCNYTSDPDTLAEETDLRCSRKSAVSCPSTRPTPGRRKSKTTPAIRAVSSLRFTQWLSTNTGLLFSIWCFMALCGGAAAADRQHPSLEKLARRNGLLVDPSHRPEPPSFHRRNKGSDSSTSSTSYAPIQASTVTLLSTGNPAAIATAQPNPSPTALPQVFDSNIGNNFTSTTCPTFFEKLDTNSEFHECYPLSLLLTVSHGRIKPLEKASNICIAIRRFLPSREELLLRHPST